MTIGVLALQGDYEAHQKIVSRVLASRGDGETRVVQVRTAQELEACDGLIIPGGESTTMSRLCDRYELWNPLREKLESGMGALGTCAGLILLAKNLEGATRNFEQKTLGVLDVDVTRNAYGAQLDSFETDIELAPTELATREYSPRENAAARDEKTARDENKNTTREYSQPGESSRNASSRAFQNVRAGEVTGDNVREHSREENSSSDAAQESDNAPPKTLRGVFIRAPRITRCGDAVKILARYEGAPVAVRQGKIVAAAFHPEMCGETRLHELWLDSLAE